ncbi:MAG: HutD family protein [Xanthobacteraceae bacterium]|nr:HutD family protein [Xanthobacteraceae bacterium]
MQIVRGHECVSTPWKNGGGRTTEIAVCPAGAGFDTFDWRISSAEVAAPGAFSVFPSIDRSLTVLSGVGLDLHVEGQPMVRLTPTSAPHRFRGDVKTSADIVDGAVRDLNVMTRRGAVAHDVDHLRCDASVQVARKGMALVVYVANGRINANLDGEVIAMLATDALVLREGDPPRIDLIPLESSRAIVIQLFRAEVGGTSDRGEARCP